MENNYNKGTEVPIRQTDIFTLKTDEKQDFALKFTKKLSKPLFKEIIQTLKKNNWRYDAERKSWVPYKDAKDKAETFLKSLYQNYGEISSDHEEKNKYQHIFKDYTNFDKDLGTFKEFDTDYMTLQEIAEQIGLRHKNELFLQAAARRISSISKEQDEYIEWLQKTCAFILQEKDVHIEKENTAENLFDNFRYATEKYRNWQEKLLNKIISKMSPEEKEKANNLLIKKGCKDKQSLSRFLSQISSENTCQPSRENSKETRREV